MTRLFPNENLQRVGFLAFVPELLRGFGVTPDAVLAAAGLKADALDDPDATIPYFAMGRVLQVCAETLHCPNFGLEVGKRIDTSSLGLVGQLMRNAPTVGSAFLDFVAHQHRNAHGGVAYAVIHNDKALFGYAVYEPNVPGNDLICDAAAMGGCNVMRELVGTDHKYVLEVLLSRTEPRDIDVYQRAFGVKLRFHAEQTALVLPRAFLDHAVIGADPNLRQTLQDRVATLWHAGKLDLLTRLRRELRVGLLDNQVSGATIAARIGVSRRTLHRRLEDYGVTFHDVLDEVRCEFARQLLTYTRLSIGDVATTVGYADPSILTRAFVRWTGDSPSNYRRHVQVLRVSAGGNCAF